MARLAAWSDGALDRTVVTVRTRPPPPHPPPPSPACTSGVGSRPDLGGGAAPSLSSARNQAGLFLHCVPYLPPFPAGDECTNACMSYGRIEFWRRVYPLCISRWSWWFVGTGPGHDWMVGSGTVDGSSMATGVLSNSGARAPRSDTCWGQTPLQPELSLWNETKSKQLPSSHSLSPESTLCIQLFTSSQLALDWRPIFVIDPTCTRSHPTAQGLTMLT